jgi:putative tryptophan/tyrosine transport system substrate-binding protein
MTRRELMLLLGGAMTAARTLRAEQKAMPVIGILAPNPKVLATLAVQRDLAALGWEAGRNSHLVLRASAGTNEALPALAADLIAQNVDLIFATGDHAIIAAAATSAGRRLQAAWSRPKQTT